jgi:hypothetical protein
MIDKIVNDIPRVVPITKGRLEYEKIMSKASFILDLIE